MCGCHQADQRVGGPGAVLHLELTDSTGRLDTKAGSDLTALLQQAATRNHSPVRELLLYALHGMLHCLGHDDHDEAAYARMHAAEDAVLTAIGVGPLFAKQGGPS